MMTFTEEKHPIHPHLPALSITRWRAEASACGTPLSRYLASWLYLLEEKAVDLIDFGSVQVDGRPERRITRVLHGTEEITIHWPWEGIRRYYELDPHRILYRDTHLLAYDKEAGVPSQQTPSDSYNNLFAALRRHIEKQGIDDPYAALHHRLDRETSGIILFALDRGINRRLGEAFQNRRVTKDYLAWISGNPTEDSWVSREDIGRRWGRYRAMPQGQGKPAETLFRVLERRGGRSLVLARPFTGRTHQIRLHLEARHQPILGDRLYGGPPDKRLWLHAWRVKFTHPLTGSDLTLCAPIPPDWPPPHPGKLPD